MTGSWKSAFWLILGKTMSLDYLLSSDLHVPWLLKRPHLTLAHWTQVSDHCPFGYLFWYLPLVANIKLRKATKTPEKTQTNIFHALNLCVKQTYYPKYDIHTSNEESSRYLAKSLDFETMFTDQTDLHIFYDVNHAIIHYSHVWHSSIKQTQDIWQNHWTVKYRSLTFTSWHESQCQRDDWCVS